MTNTFIDVREYPEYAAGHIKNAKLVPLGTLRKTSKDWDKDYPLTLVCKSGNRAEQARKSLSEEGFSALSVLTGGMDAWIGHGKPLEVTAHQPWAMERQVRTAAGCLIMVSLALGTLKSRHYLLATALVGSGLIYAGMSNTCMMATVLARMPWNRPAPVEG